MKEVLSKQAVKIAKRAEEHESFINKVCFFMSGARLQSEVSVFLMLFYLYFLAVFYFVLLNFIFFIMYGHLGM